MLKKMFIFIFIKKYTLILICIVFLVFTAKFFSISEVIAVLSSGFNPITGKSIVIDPGHGGIDGGTHFQNEILEKDLNLQISLKLKNMMESVGARVVLTRNKDMELGHLNKLSSSRHRRDLISRAQIINSVKPDVFLSIHINANDRQPEMRGPIVFYGSALPQSMTLAFFIQMRLNAMQPENTDFVQERNTPICYDYYLLKTVKYPGVIIETGFITNEMDRKLLQQPDYQKQVCEAIINGLKDYFIYIDKPIY